MNEIKTIRTAIEKLVSGELETYEWDDAMSIKCEARSAEALRQLAWQVSELFPPNNPKEYCSDKGIQFLRLLLEASAES